MSRGTDDRSVDAAAVVDVVARCRSVGSVDEVDVMSVRCNCTPVQRPYHRTGRVVGKRQVQQLNPLQLTPDVGDQDEAEDQSRFQVVGMAGKNLAAGPLGVVQAPAPPECLGTRQGNRDVTGLSDQECVDAVERGIQWLVAQPPAGHRHRRGLRNVRGSAVALGVKAGKAIADLIVPRVQVVGTLERLHRGPQSSLGAVDYSQGSEGGSVFRIEFEREVKLLTGSLVIAGSQTGLAKEGTSPSVAGKRAQNVLAEKARVRICAEADRAVRPAAHLIQLHKASHRLSGFHAGRGKSTLRAEEAGVKEERCKSTPYFRMY